jgi:hypothetical protein
MPLVNISVDLIKYFLFSLPPPPRFRDRIARARAATAVPAAPPFLHVPRRALWFECGPVEKEKKGLLPRPIPAVSHVAVCMPAASKEAV